MEKKSVSIAGAGRIEGGTYERVKLAGAGTIAGDVEAEEFKAAGSCKVEGNLQAQKFESAGAFKVEGDLTVEEGEASGAFKVTGKVLAQELRLSGGAKCGGIRGGFLRASGGLEVEGDVEVDTFRVSGSLQIGGLLSADTIEIRLEGASRAREIGGEKIVVRQGTSGSVLSEILGRLRWGGARELIVNTLEGDELDLEGVVAQVVRGQKVKIGQGCRIGRLEYTASCEVHPEAEVKERSQG